VEYDLHEVASLCRLRSAELVGQGAFRDESAAHHYAEQLDALHLAPDDAKLASRLGIGADLLDPARRTRDVKNWLASLGGDLQA